MKKSLILIGIPVCVILVFFWVYFPTLTRYRELKIEQDEIEKKIADLDEKITALSEEKVLLEQDKEYIEKVIRDELGLVKPGEVVYKFIEERRAPHEQSLPKNGKGKFIEERRSTVPGTTGTGSEPEPNLSPAVPGTSQQDKPAAEPATPENA